ncbi:hypothetical protein LguiA_004863 [Lonicera macranthoides]
MARNNKSRRLILATKCDCICGGRLLNLIHKQCQPGVPQSQTCIQRYYLVIYIILFQCLRSAFCPGDLWWWSYLAIKKLLETTIWFQAIDDAYLPGWHLGFSGHLALFLLSTQITTVSATVLFQNLDSAH